MLTRQRRDYSDAIEALRDSIKRHDTAFARLLLGRAYVATHSPCWLGNSARIYSRLLIGGAAVPIVGAAVSIVDGRGIVRVGAARLCHGIAGNDQIVGKSLGQAVLDTVNEVANGEAIHERRGRWPRDPNTNAPLRIKTRRIHNYLTD
jgi:hypothetical protein